MGRKRRTADFSIDLDKLFGLGERMPQILAQFTKGGVQLGDGLQKGLLMLSMGTGILGDLFVTEDDAEETGLEISGVDTGPSGKGLREYLLRGREFSDEEVSTAVLFIIDENPAVNGKPVAPMPGAGRVRCAIDFALDIHGQTIASSTHEEFRAAFDCMLRSKVLGDATTDKLGDHVWYTLCAQRRRIAIPVIPTVQTPKE